METENTIRVTIAAGEDRTLAEELHLQLEGRDGISLAGELAGGEEMPAASAADMIIVAGQINGDNVRRLVEAAPRARVVLVTDNVVRDLAPAIKAGVAGILPADAEAGDLIETIRRVHLWSHRLVALV